MDVSYLKYVTQNYAHQRINAMLKVQNIETDRYAALVNEDRGHIVCWATSVKHKNIAQQWFSLLLIFFSQLLSQKNLRS